MQNIAIFGAPRSGTSWLGQIFNSSPHVAYRFQPIFAYSFEGSIDGNSSVTEIKHFHEALLETDDPFVCAKINTSGNKTPDFQKKKRSHLIWKEVRYINIIENLLEHTEMKIIGVVRHPCGVIKSWTQAPHEFDPSWDIAEEWRNASRKNKGSHEFYGYEQWIKVARLFIRWEKAYPDQFKTTVYEELLGNTQEGIENLFTFIDLKMDDQSRKFIEESTSKSSDDPYGVYRLKKSGYDWVDELPDEIIAEIIRDERFQRLNNYFNWKSPKIV